MWLLYLEFKRDIKLFLDIMISSLISKTECIFLHGDTILILKSELVVNKFETLHFIRFCMQLIYHNRDERYQWYNLYDKKISSTSINFSVRSILVWVIGIINWPSQVGAGLSKLPVVEEPSPPHVKDEAPTIPKPTEQEKLHTLPKLLVSLHTGAFPFAGVVRAGHVIAVFGVQERYSFIYKRNDLITWWSAKMNTFSILEIQFCFWNLN